MMRIAKGRRPNTLRKHVKTWQKVGQWLELACGKPWPSHAAEFAEYLEAIVQEPCARSAPEAAYKTLMFLEQQCRQQGIQCIVHDVDIQNSADWDLSLEVRGSAEVAGSREGW